MKRPDTRPMQALPMLEERRSTLEKCVFCPRLCRSACPVSNAEPRETLTPWGKMSMAYFVAQGDVALDRSFAAPAWACTSCFSCRESCDHRNDVASTLLAARYGLLTHGLAPERVAQSVAKFPSHQDKTRQAVRELSAHEAVRSDSRDALLIGCGYARGAMTEARDAITATAALLGGPVTLVETCCGMPLLSAGDHEGFARQAALLAEETKRFDRIIVADAGCAMALRKRYAEHGVTLSARVELLIEHAAKELARLAVLGDGGESVRYHDPCQLGRGLGLFDEPRAILGKILGRAPDEFPQRREHAVCSGGGGLLPVSMPETARGIADTRLDEHERAGGGRIVTACASSLISLRKRGRAPVDDIVGWIARAVRPLRPVA